MVVALALMLKYTIMYMRLRQLFPYSYDAAFEIQASRLRDGDLKHRSHRDSLVDGAVNLDGNKKGFRFSDCLARCRLDTQHAIDWFSLDPAYISYF